jgi:L-amino acid N-acyltransferase YncA
LEILNEAIANATALYDYRPRTLAQMDSWFKASQHRHASLGFAHTGTLRQAGFKFGQWLDVDFYQLILATPFKPVDG